MNRSIPFGRFQSRRDASVNGRYIGEPVSDSQLCHECGGLLDHCNCEAKKNGGGGGEENKHGGGNAQN